MGGFTLPVPFGPLGPAWEPLWSPSETWTRTEAPAGIPGPEDLADALERRLRPLYGTGHYGGEGSPHQAYRRGQVYGLALYWAALSSVRYNAVPTRAVALLDEWEAILGVPVAPDMAIEHRRERIAGRIAEQVIPTVSGINHAIDTLCGAHVAVVSASPDPFRYDVTFTGITSANRHWPDVNRLLWRMTPAHAACYIKFGSGAFAPLEEL